MKSILLKITYILVLLGLFLPSGLFQNIVKDRASEVETKTNPQIAIVVNSGQVSSEVKVLVTKQATTVFSCQPGVFELFDPVSLQGGLKINLDQPANCFAIVANKKQNFSQKITPAPIKILPVVKVAVNKSFYQKENFSRNPGSKPDTTGAVVVFVAMLNIFVFRKILSRSVKTITNINFYTPNVFTLQVLRC